ncbi:MAG: tetratricopeptide repeat protein [Candidatus Thorarchaeota archaeon]
MYSEELELALKAIEEQRFEDAVTILERLTEANPDNPEAFVYLGLAYLQAEKPHQAIEVLLEAEDSVEDHCVIAQFLGRAYKAIKEYSPAEFYLRKAITLDPDIYEAWLDLGEVLYFTRQYGEAARVLEDAVFRFPEDPALHSIRAMSLYRLGDYTEAAREWGAVSTLRPESIVALTNYAYLLLFLGMVDEAEPVVRKARVKFPDSYRAIMLEGELRFQRGEYQAAQAYFRRALSICSDSVEALSRLAVIAHRLGNSSQADEYLATAKKIVEADPPTWQRLCNAHVDLERFDEHLECLNEIVQQDRHSSAAWIALAVEYTRRGRLDEAKSAWRMSIQLRGYIKVFCPRCGVHVRIPHLEPCDVDLDGTVQCVYCCTSLPLPDSLSRV